MSSRSSATAHDAPLPDEEASLTGGRPLSDAACHTGAGAFAVPASPSLLSPPRGPAGWGRGRSGLYAFPWTRLREAFYATVIAVLCVLVLVLAIARTGSRQLAPYCLFAVGGGYMEGTAFPQEDRLASSDCNAAIKAYLTEGQYETDVETVAQDALDVLRGLSAPNATYVLVFDIDETVLSNMAEFEHMRYGKKPYDGAWEHAWQLNATAPALEPMLRLYERAFDMGLSVTFITGRAEWSRNATQFNLKHSGFGEQCAPEQPRNGSSVCYERLDLREDGDKRPASVYKPERRGRLEAEGYILLASFGDQWSDLVGEHSAQANFKLPNPMYYLL